MAIDDYGQRDQDTGGTPAERKCRTASDILKSVTDEINAYETRKLGELKAALEAFVKTQDQVVEAYRTKYPALRKTWCERQQDVERLYAHIKCEFPLDNEKWRTLIERCICQKRYDITCLKKRIARRKRCCNGPLQRARDEAQARFDVAKAELETLQNLAQRIADALAANLNTIGEIEKLPSGERTVAIWLFWFKLLENHKKLTPRDVPDSCKHLGDDGGAAAICTPINAKPCPTDDDACSPPAGYTEPALEEPRGPWLMPPDDYRNALDCAWEKYDEAKKQLADANAKYKANPDDLESLETRLKGDITGLEGEIKKCLKEVKATEDCCKPTTGDSRTGA